MLNWTPQGYTFRGAIFWSKNSFSHYVFAGFVKIGWKKGSIKHPASYIYIYICCRKGIWSPRGGDLVPKTLPTAEPSILARGIQEKTTGSNGSVLRDQIPLVRGPNPPLSRPSPRRPRKQSPKVLRNHYFYSGFANFGALFSGSPKNKKTASCRECYYLRSLSRGSILYNFPLLVFV